jgi:hypothetical protein
MAANQGKANGRLLPFVPVRSPIARKDQPKSENLSLLSAERTKHTEAKA